MSGEKSLFGGAKTPPPPPETDEGKKQRDINAKRQKTLATYTEAVDRIMETLKKTRMEEYTAPSNLEKIRNIEKAAALLEQVKEWEKDEDLVGSEEWKGMEAISSTLLEEVKICHLHAGMPPA